MNSMTGFGRAVAQTDRYNILVEISGVNRKQTEIAVNVPRSYAEWDAPVRSIVQGAVSRGAWASPSPWNGWRKRTAPSSLMKTSWPPSRGC